jgi:hypothetical protein
MDLLAAHLDLDKLDQLLHAKQGPSKACAKNIEALAAWD